MKKHCIYKVVNAGENDDRLLTIPSIERVSKLLISLWYIKTAYPGHRAIEYIYILSKLYTEKIVFVGKSAKARIRFIFSFFKFYFIFIQLN